MGFALPRSQPHSVAQFRPPAVRLSGFGEAPTACRVRSDSGPVATEPSKHDDLMRTVTAPHVTDSRKDRNRRGTEGRRVRGVGRIRAKMTAGPLSILDSRMGAASATLIEPGEQTA